MFKTTFAFLLIFILSIHSSLSAQDESISVHKQHWQEYSHLAKQSSAAIATDYEIAPLASRLETSLTRKVFGYLPDWQYKSARNYLQYDLLTHIAAFDFNVSASGAITDPAFWPWIDVMNAAHENGVKMILCAVNFNADDIHNLLTNTTAKNNFFAQLKTKINAYSLDGVNIDFESLHTADRGSLLNGFMADLTAYMHQEFPGSEVSFAGPAVNWSGWDLSGLADACDYIFIMGYSFYGSWSTTSGPCAPLTGPGKHITNTVEVQYADVTANHPQKLILGVPYYGNRWDTVNNQAYSDIEAKSNSVFYASAVSEGESHGILWDNISQTPWFPYQDAGDWHQVWFDSRESLAQKYDLADSKNYLGVGMWALGYDGARTELWDELRSRYLTDIEESEVPNYPATFELQQNYPNPFNPTTVISYQLSVMSEVNLSIYSVLGQKVATLVSGMQTAGEYKIEWDASAFTSGIYYYSLHAGNYVKTYKMVLLK